MEKKAASGIMLTLLLTSILALALNIQAVRASGTIYIRNDGSVDPPTAPIQRDGDTYTFTANINDLIRVERNNITIDGAGYTLKGTGGSTTGIYLNWMTNVTIKNTQIESFGYGIRLIHSANNTVSGNNVTKNAYGIMLFYSSNNRISGNNISKGYDGISLSESSNYNRIAGNNITDNYWKGIRIEGYYESSSNSISNNNIAHNDDGIILSESPNNIISENNITDNWYGLELTGSANNNIKGNNIADNGYGISLGGSSNNTISGSNIAGNYWDGIWLYSSDNTLSGNNVTAHNEADIRIGGSSNRISSNNIANNYAGIMLYGSASNIIHHNNFIDNSRQVYDWSWYRPGSVPPSINVWDDGYPSGGNYWSDYSINYPAVGDGYQGESQNLLGSDGIWDHPYEIDAGNQDNYPLTEPWTAVERKVGVKVGDWVKYGNFDVSWRSNDPDATMPVGIAILREVEWWKNSVEDILDTKIRYQQLLHFKDGSEYSTTCWIDIDTGSGTPLSFASSGLISDDCIYASAPWYAWKINETISHACAGVNRETNHLNVTTSMQMGPPPLCPNTTGNFYWDKETGVLCELSMIHLNQTETYVTSWSVFYKIVDTNLWKASVVSAFINIHPDTLHPRSHGRWITAYIQLPEEYNPADIDASTILLNGTVAPVLDSKYGFVTNSSEYLVDHNGDGILERVVKFDRAAVSSLVCSQRIRYGDVALTMTGTLFDETPFEATGTVILLFPGDADVDFNDFIIFAGCYGTSIENSSYVSRADFNEDRTIDYNDFTIFADNYGKTVL